eukprot:9195182-Pyramimonas_sp.AAC.1
METVLKVAHSKIHEVEKNSNLLPRRSHAALPYRARDGRFQGARDDRNKDKGYKAKLAIRGNYTTVRETEDPEDDQHNGEESEHGQEHDEDHEEDPEVYFEDQEDDRDQLEEEQ